MKRRDVLVLGLAFFGMITVAQAADPAGTWTWTQMGQNGQSREVTLKLKFESDKLSGFVLGRDNAEIKIDDATFKDNEVAFSVTRERQGQKFTTKYKGKLDGDTIKGKAETQRDGNTNSRDWEAKRQK